MIVLAIESTCDETACAIVSGKDDGAEILANVTASSAEILSKYGGVVPEVAAREQVAAIVPVIKEALQKPLLFHSTPSPAIAGASPTLGAAITGIDAVAVAYGPGLVGSLLIGIETAKALALAWNKPLVRVNHMAAHIFANWIMPSTASDTVTQSHSDTVPELPAVGLVVSGGHTDIILLKSLTNWEWLGGTRDDAAGEAYDKAARILGLPYPGGPAIAKLAETAKTSPLPSPTLGEGMRLPRPMIHEDTLDMSFSGLKTALVQLAVDSKQLTESEKALLAREFNEAVTEVLVSKTMKAVEIYQPKSVLLAGGVAANSLLRQELAEKLKNSRTQNIKLFVPEMKYCTDNAAMIGAAALMRLDYIDPLLLRPEPGLEII